MMSHEARSSTLECGRELLPLVEQVTDGAVPIDPEHQANCPYCQEALCRIRTADHQLRGLAGETVRVPHGLARRVMAQLRRERGRVPLLGAAGRDLNGSDTVSDLVILQIVRRAARTVDGVVQCSVELEPATADGELTLTVHLTAVFGPNLPGLADEVREAVIADLLAYTGLQAGPLTVEIDDIVTP